MVIYHYVYPEGPTIYYDRNDTNAINYVSDNMLMINSLYHECSLYLAADNNVP